MKVITYFAFTALSILIQFSLMDIIQNSLMIENKNTVDLNLTSQNNPFGEVFSEYNALFFKTSPVLKRSAESTTKLITTNTATNKLVTMKAATNKLVATKTATTKLVTTNAPTTIEYEVALEEDEASTTEVSETTDSSTEYENVTEFISIFGKKNDSKPVTTEKPNLIEVPRDGKCACDLLFHQCDLNCCCDGDCSNDDRKIFGCPHEVPRKRDDYFCPFEERSLLADNIDNLFCVAKTNLPDKRVVDSYKYKKDDVDAIIASALKWHGQAVHHDDKLVFTPKNYTSGDPIWLLHKENISYLDFPVAAFSDYCDKRNPIRFLKKSKSRCKVTFPDLEVLNIMNKIEETVVVTVTDNFRNTSILNCSSLHCVNWKLVACNVTTCTTYKKTLHQPACTEFLCTGLAHKILYHFHINGSTITNATVHFYTRNVSTKTQFLTQSIEIDFFITPKSNETRVVRLSGNPGYLKGYPIIASYSKENHTRNFFNTEIDIENELLYPENEKGMCVLNNVTRKIVNFGLNKRCKCRYGLSTNAWMGNATATCQSLWNEAKRLINMAGKNIFISPFGNPQDLADNDWIKINEINTQVPVYGQFNAKDSTIYCNSVVSKISYVFGYADVSEVPDEVKIKILSANVLVTADNRTFSKEDISVVATFETMFIDVTKPPVYEYAGSPQLHIHLPKDFFFPFQNKTCDLTSNILLIILCFLILT